jgi:hypothetical protein
LSNEDLLRPTLSEFRRPPAIYSSTGFFLSTFFGGPVGTVVYGLCNSHRLGRLRIDLPVFLALAAAAYFLVLLFQNGGQMAWIIDQVGDAPRPSLEFTLRVLALGCHFAIYLMHRKFFRAAQVSGVKSLPGWVPGIAALVLGNVANQAFIGWILQHH